MDIGAKVTLRAVWLDCGAADRADTQTLHFAASVPLAWWCAAKPTADQKVNRRQTSATDFLMGRKFFISEMLF